MSRASWIGILLAGVMGCAPRMYRVCETGSYTGDRQCSAPMPKPVARAEVIASEPSQKPHLERAKRGETNSIYVMSGERK